MVSEYLDTRPDPSAFDFLRCDFETLESRFGGVVGTSFRSFPSYPQRFIERLATQPACEIDMSGINSAAGKMTTTYSDFGTPVDVQRPPAAQVQEAPANIPGLTGGN